MRFVILPNRCAHRVGWCQPPRVVAVNMARYDQAVCTEAGARADNICCRPLPFMMRILHAAQDRSRPAVPLLFRG